MARYVQLAPTTAYTTYHCLCCCPAAKTTVAITPQTISIRKDYTNACGCETGEEKAVLRHDQITAMRTTVGCFDPTPCQIMSCVAMHADCPLTYLHINASGIEYSARMTARDAAVISSHWSAPPQQEMH